MRAREPLAPDRVSGTRSSNPLPFSGESGANSTHGFGDLPPHPSLLAGGTMNQKIKAQQAVREECEAAGRLADPFLLTRG
jgi:hypothetical protein